MHAILVTVGTDDDVFPYAALGTTLRARGHRVTLMTNENRADGRRAQPLDERRIEEALPPRRGTFARRRRTRDGRQAGRGARTQT